MAGDNYAEIEDLLTPDGRVKRLSEFFKFNLSPKILYISGMGVAQKIPTLGVQKVKKEKST